MSNDSAGAAAPGASAPNVALAANLRRLRVAARLSLSELARTTGVGKATLSAIENGRGNPTVETLAALAGALGVPVVDLLDVPEPAPVTVVRAGAGEALDDGLERVGRIGGGGADLQRATFAPNALVEAPPRAAGARIHLVVTGGTLVAGPAERISELGPGDYVAFPADVPHVFRTARRGADAVLVVEPG
jgi:transcriptional regulator with XRE-family HTH domain